MKIEVDLKEFRDVFGEASGIIRNNSPKEVFKFVRVRPDGDGIELTGTNGEVSVSCYLPATVSQKDTFLLPAARVGSILRTLSLGTLQIEVVNAKEGGEADAKVILRTGHSRFTVPSMSPEEFPAVTEFDVAGTISASAEAIAAAFSRTVFATDVASTRYALSGVFVDAGKRDGKVVFAATDSKRLSVVEIAADVGGDFNSPVVPAAAIVAFLRCDRRSECTIEVGQNSIRMICGATTITSRLVDGRFPQYGSIIPRQAAHVVDMVASELASVCQQAMVMTSEESKGVVFAFRDGLLSLKSSAASIGESDVALPISWSTAPMEITLIPEQITQALKTLPGGHPVSLSLNDGESPALFRSPDVGWTYLLMPLTPQTPKAKGAA